MTAEAIVTAEDGAVFAAITRAVADPMLLVSVSGRVLGANAALYRVLPGARVGADLYALTGGDPRVLAEALWRWSRSGAPLPGRLESSGGPGRRFRCFGARAPWVRDAEGAVQIRLVPDRRRTEPAPVCPGRDSERRLRARLKDEHASAMRLQRGLLPERIDLTPLEAAVDYRPTVAGNQAGGDWYDLFTVPGTATSALVIGDVAGHGPDEAMVMAQLRTVLRAACLDQGGRPDRIAHRLDAYMSAFLPESMATMCYLVHDPAVGRIRYSNAGHVPPLLLRPDGRCTRLPGAPDPPLGCALGTEYRSRSVRVAPG
ncbi:PP2C family protein-serine/threonine phosphatase, partial [Nocardiopsis halophila]|uniref:PP2C family protein-serine/threonine phosphatase n=1 Tax=Nocardiopsis halophila TaxID=141692 RepID=UPI0003658CAC